MENIKSTINIVMNENELKNMNHSELIALVMKLNKKANQKPKSDKPKPVKPKSVKPKLNYNLQELFDDDQFPDFNPGVTPFDKKMREIRRLERKINKMSETVENKYTMLQTGEVVITYPKIDVSMNKFRREESRLTFNKKGSSFFNLFERRLSTIPGKREKISITINVDIWNGIVTSGKTYGPFSMKIPKLNKYDMYKYMVYDY